MKAQRRVHLALLKIGVPWQQALDMSETEAGGYLDAYAEMNGIKKKSDPESGQKHFRATRRMPRKHP